MARLINFSRRSTVQLQKILTFYDERNGSDNYSCHLLKCLLEEIQRVSMTPTSQGSTNQYTTIVVQISGLISTPLFVLHNIFLSRTSHNAAFSMCRRSVRGATASGAHWGCLLQVCASPVPVLP